MKKALKISALLMAFVLVIAGTVGVTLALLTDKTDPIKNTFTIGKVEITLTETTGNSYKLVPGTTVNKDPKVTVDAGSEACYLFVKLDKSDNFGDFLTYSMAEGWTQLKDKDDKDVLGVYYRIVATSSKDTTFSVLSNDQVKVKETVTKEDMTSDDYSNPTLTVTAYATQLYKANNTQFEPYEAWEKVYSTGSTD